MILRLTHQQKKEPTWTHKKFRFYGLDGKAHIENIQVLSMNKASNIALKIDPADGGVGV